MCGNNTIYWEGYMKLTKSAAILAASTVAILGATITANAAGLTAQEKALVPLAAKEGKVTVINPLFADRTARRLGTAFKKRYGLPDSFKFNSQFHHHLSSNSLII